MITFNGSVTLGGVTDREMVKIWEAKTKHGTKLQFNPQQFQIVHNQQQGTTYNNVQFTYGDLHSLNILTELINELHRKEEVTAAGQ